jgi:hypothetical protein
MEWAYVKSHEISKNENGSNAGNATDAIRKALFERQRTGSAKKEKTDFDIGHLEK